MSGFTTQSISHLVRSNIWSQQLKDVLLDELYGMKYVRMLDFADGDTFNIPSVSQMETYNYAEGQAIKYTAMDKLN